LDVEECLLGLLFYEWGDFAGFLVVTADVVSLEFGKWGRNVPRVSGYENPFAGDDGC
jgi:hypothetical protein